MSAPKPVKGTWSVETGGWSGDEVYLIKNSGFLKKKKKVYVGDLTSLSAYTDQNIKTLRKAAELAQEFNEKGL